MAHVEISVQENGVARILVDGHDLSKSILARGFEVRANPKLPGPTQWEVHCIVRADVLEVNLPDALLAALRSDGEGGIEA